MKRKLFALVSTKEYRSIPHLFILRVLETKNCFPPRSVVKSKLDRSQVRRPRKESRPRPLRFPPELTLNRPLVPDHQRRVQGFHRFLGSSYEA